MKSCWWMLAFIVGGGHALAQVDGQTTFRSGVDLVALNVVVTSPQEKFVSGLSAADFSVFEDGVQQDISFFSATAVPLDLAILLDTSASMTDRINTVQEAAIGFASTLTASDRVMIVDIKDAVRVLQPLGEDLDAARTAIRGTFARGGTALYNGLYTTVKEMMKQRRDNGEVRREAIVVLSDGQDTASLVTYDDVMELAKQAGIIIYTITLKAPYQIDPASSGYRRFSQGEFAMKALAQETGGRSFAPADVAELAGVYGDIAEELASQYALGYTSKNPRTDGGYRRIIVRVDEPGVRTRTRAGYAAPQASRAQGLR